MINLPISSCQRRIASRFLRIHMKALSHIHHKTVPGESFRVFTVIFLLLLCVFFVALNISFTCTTSYRFQCPISILFYFFMSASSPASYSPLFCCCRTFFFLRWLNICRGLHHARSDFFLFTSLVFVSSCCILLAFLRYTQKNRENLCYSFRIFFLFCSR